VARIRGLVCCAMGARAHCLPQK